MKNIALLLTIVSLAIFSSCGKDDPGIVNSIVYDGETYTPSTGIILDYGTIQNTHYNYDFYISDGEFSIEGNQFNVSEDVNFILYVELVSNGSDAFTTGTFDFNNSTILPEKNIFATTIMNVRDGNQFLQTLGSGGEVTVSGTAPNFTLTFNVTYQGTELTGAFSGTFDIQDGI